MNPHPQVHEAIHEHLLLRAGLASPPPPRYRLQDLEASEWSPEFERLMRNRLIMGALRYGPLNAPGKPAYDRINGAIKRLIQYLRTGNTEALVDVANMALLEFEEGRHPHRHFGPLEGDHCCE